MQKICIIIPCYNEEKRLDTEFLTDFLRANSTLNLLFVNDGSSDATASVLDRIRSEFPDSVTVINLEKNKGKAEAVRHGMMTLSVADDFQFLGYFDADFATPLSEALPMLNLLVEKNLKFVLGSRIKRLGARVERTKTRHITGRVFSTFASLILDLPVYDTQCGAKIISRDWVETAFSKSFISSWLFDVEILARIRNNYGKATLLDQTMEAPLNTWIEKGGSKIKLVHLIKIPLELIRIHFTYNQKSK
ncbi:MAG: glycosyltransferase [Bacteroidia bacterium]